MKKTIDIYLAKLFLKNFLIVIGGFAILFFIINLVEIFDRVEDGNSNLIILLFLAFLKTPQSLTSVVLSVVLISAIYTFYQLSNRCELVVIRNCGYSLWKISRPLIIASLVLAIFWITIFNFLETFSLKKYNVYEAEFIETEMRENILTNEGLWLKQSINENQGYNIILVRKIFKNSQQLFNNTIWFFDKNYNFYKRIDARRMVLTNKHWKIDNAILNDNNNINTEIANIEISTDIDEDFLQKKIINLENTVDYYNIFELPNIINELEKSGLNSKKYKIYFNVKLNYLILFVSMILFAIYFGENLSRNRDSAIKLFYGIVFGLLVFLSSSIFSTLGSSNILTIFEATWLVSLFYLAISIILIYRKENSAT